MAIFHCETCDVTKTVPDKFVGRTVQCPKCEQPVVIAPEEEEDSIEEVEIPPEPDLDGDDDEPEGGGLVIPESGEEEPDDSVPLFSGNLVKNVFAGIVSGLVAFLFCLAFAALVFAGPGLSEYMPHAVSMALVSALVVGLLTSLTSRVPFALGGPEAAVAVLLFLMAASVQKSMAAAGHPALTIYPTLVAAIAITAFVAGILVFLTGKIGAGPWLRFIPFQIVGGVLAGVGLLLIKGANEFAQAGPCINDLTRTLGVDLSDMAAFVGLDPCCRWIPAFATGLILFLVLRWARNPLALLILVALAAGGAHGAFYALGVSFPKAASLGWLMAPYEMDRFWEIYNLTFLESIKWDVILAQAPYMAAMAFLVVATKMQKITRLELLLERQIDLDKELRSDGLANCFAGLAGGMPGTLSLARSLYARSMGAEGPVAGMVAALFCGGLLVYHFMVVPFIPTFVPAGLLVYLGLDLVWRWLVDVREEFTRLDEYAQLLLVFLVTAFLGLLLGVGVGIAMAMMVLVSRYARIDVVKHSLSGATNRSNVDRGARQIKLLNAKGGQIFIMRLQGFIFLGTTNSIMSHIYDRIRATDQLPVRFIILDFTLVNGLDSSVAISFTRLKQMARENRVTLIFTNVPFEVEQELEQGGYKLNDPDGSSRTFMDLDFAMEWCENQILALEGVDEDERVSLPELLEPIFPEPRFIPHLMKTLQRVEVPKGQPVFRQGDPSDSMYFLESGMVTIQLELEGNKILRLKKLAPGTVFGEMGLYTTAPRSASVVAAEDCVLYRLTTKTLNALQSKAPVLVSAVHRFIVNLLAQRVAATNAMVRDLQR